MAPDPASIDDGAVTSMTDRDDAADMALGHIRRAISSDYPWATLDHIGEVLRSGYDRTRDAKVQNYRLLLAEREARAQLRHEQAGRHLATEGADDP